MKINSKEARVLACVELDSEVSIEEVARRAALKSHQAVYYLKKLETEGILGQRRFLINMPRLEFSDVTIFFSLSSPNARVKQKLLAEIIKCPHVSWLSELGGVFQYAFSFLTKRPAAVQEYLEQLSDKVGDIFLHKSLHVRSHVFSYGRKYLSPLARHTRPLVLGGAPISFDLDITDMTILSGLANARYLSLRDLAHTLKLPFSTLQRRIHVMKEAGIIDGSYYSVNPMTLGVQVFNLFLFSKRVSADFAEQLETFCRNHDHVVHFIRGMGEWDFEVVVEGYSALTASEVASEIMDKFGDSIREIQPFPVFRYLKSSLYPWTS